MPSQRKLPATASIALPADNGKLHAPSAARNGSAIVEALQGVIPQSGRALEIASGTGEHMVRFARCFPDMLWQPTDIEADRLESIAAWCTEAGVSNVLPPLHLNATVAGWAAKMPANNLVFLSNLLHLISANEAQTLIAEAAQSLAPGGVFLIYGPFMRGEAFASAADRSFHQSLQAQDARIGYKTVRFVQQALTKAGLTLNAPIEMPSHNLILSGVRASGPA